MDDVLDPGVEITRAELRAVTEVVMLRFPLRAQESRRVERVQALLHVSSELARAISVHTQHALVHSRGTYGTGNLTADTDTLYLALDAYGAAVRELAAEYRSFVGESADPRPPDLSGRANPSFTTPLSAQ